MDQAVSIREERDGDRAEVHEVNRQAFQTSVEADLVDALRGAARPWISLVADYYPRFGFQPAAPRGLHYKGPEFDPYFMVAELEPGALEGWAGRVEYRPEFEGV